MRRAIRVQLSTEIFERTVYYAKVYMWNTGFRNYTGRFQSVTTV